MTLFDNVHAKGGRSVRHQHVGIHPHRIALTHHAQQVEKVPVVPVIGVDPMPIYPAVCDVIPPAATINPQGSAHASCVPKGALPLKSF